MQTCLQDVNYIDQHKSSTRSFTRLRVLSFKVIFTLLLAKGMKSLQLSLNEFIPKLRLVQTSVSNAAYSKARHKLKHTAFIAMNQAAVVTTMYEDGDYQTLHGFRILAVDGSKVQLPTNSETKEAFGAFAYRSQRPQVAGEHSYALASVLYDVLNRVALDAQLAPAHTYEVEAATKHLRHTTDADIVIYDRGYCSFRMFVLASQAKGEFLVRCHDNSFKVVNDMLKGEGADDSIVELHASAKYLQNPANEGLPQTSTVRFIRVTLDTGEYEVLATSLLDQTKYPLAIFKELYYYRWGIETFYGILKTRLTLENFSGHSPEAIRQDFHAAVLLTGIESIFTEDAETKLTKQAGEHQKKVNKAVSFNAIKYRAFELFMRAEPQEQVLEELTELFMHSPTLVRKNRKPPRTTSSSHQVLGYWKRKRKAVF